MKPERYGNMLEINVTDACQLDCSHCNRLCGVAPSNNHISVDKIEKLCSEIPHIDQICIAGGDPMMHPNIEQIVKIIVNSGKADNIRLLTNGVSLTEYYNELAEKYGLEAWNSGKDKTPPEHNLLMTVAPVDVNLYGVKPIESCDILSRCGIGYSEDGYYPCCISAAIGRVFGIKGAQSWEEFGEEAYMELLDKTCRYCGYYLTSKVNTILPEFNYPKDMMTVSWKESIRRYNAK